MNEILQFTMIEIYCENISKEFISEEVVRQAIEKNIIYLTYADPN